VLSVNPAIGHHLQLTVLSHNKVLAFSATGVALRRHIYQSAALPAGRLQCSSSMGQQVPTDVTAFCVSSSSTVVAHMCAIVRSHANTNAHITFATNIQHSGITLAMSASAAGSACRHTRMVVPATHMYSVYDCSLGGSHVHYLHF
jgi:hypothetical protein